MPPKKTKNNFSSLTVGNITLAGTDKQIKKMLEDRLKSAEKESKLSAAEKKKRLEKLEKAKPVKVKPAVPSYVNFKGQKYSVTEVRGNKIKITDPKTGGSITLPKGTGINPTDIKFMNASQKIGLKKSTQTQGTRVVKFRGGGAGGGAFLENLK